MIDKLATIDASAKLGKNVSVGKNSIIKENVIIGDDTIIKENVIIEKDTIIGKNNTIYPFVTIGGDAQSLGHEDKNKCIVKIGDDNIIREYVSIHKGTDKDNNITQIGDKNFIMAYAHLGHDSIIGNENIITNAVQIAGHVHIGNGVNIGGAALIHQFSKIGDFAMLAGGCALSQDLPPYCMSAGGYHSKIIGLNKIGLRRRLKRDDIKEIESAFRAIFNKNTLPKDKAKELMDSAENIYVINLCKFILNSKRGVKAFNG